MSGEQKAIGDSSRIYAILDEIRQSISGLALSLARLEGWAKGHDASEARMDARIAALDDRLKVLENVHLQAQGAAKAGRIMWAGAVAVAAGLGWLLRHVGLKP